MAAVHLYLKTEGYLDDFLSTCEGSRSSKSYAVFRAVQTEKCLSADAQLMARLSKVRSPSFMKIAVSATSAAMIRSTGMCGTDGVSAARIPSAT